MVNQLKCVVQTFVLKILVLTILEQIVIPMSVKIVNQDILLDIVKSQVFVVTILKPNKNNFFAYKL